MKREWRSINRTMHRLTQPSAYRCAGTRGRETIAEVYSTIDGWKWAAWLPRRAGPAPITIISGYTKTANQAKRACIAALKMMEEA